MANHHSYIPKTNAVLRRVLCGDQTVFHFLVENTGSSTHAPPRACLPLNITMCHSTEVKVSPSELPLTGIKAGLMRQVNRESESHSLVTDQLKKRPSPVRLPMMGGSLYPRLPHEMVRSKFPARLLDGMITYS